MSEQNTNSQCYLTYSSCNRIYGIDTKYVIEIINNHNITPLPMAPDFVKGIINLRGQIVPIIDIRKRMGKTAISMHESNCIIILNINSMSVGILVDGVSQVLDLDTTTITTVPIKDQGNLVYGMVELKPNEIILLLDCEQLLN